MGCPGACSRHHSRSPSEILAPVEIAVDQPGRHTIGPARCPVEIGQVMRMDQERSGDGQTQADQREGPADLPRIPDSPSTQGTTFPAAMNT